MATSQAPKNLDLSSIKVGLRRCGRCTHDLACHGHGSIDLALLQSSARTRRGFAGPDSRSIAKRAAPWDVRRVTGRVTCIVPSLFDPKRTGYLAHGASNESLHFLVSQLPEVATVFTMASLGVSPHMHYAKSGFPPRTKFTSAATTTITATTKAQAKMKRQPGCLAQALSVVFHSFVTNRRKALSLIHI